MAFFCSWSGLGNLQPGDADIQARGDLVQLRNNKNKLENDLHTQTNLNQRLNILVSALESQVKSLTSQLSQLDPDLASTAVAENVQLAQEKNVLVKENDSLKIAIKAQQESIDDHKLQVAEAHCDLEKLRSELDLSLIHI